MCAWELETKTLTDASGFPYVTMKVPAGWSCTVEEDRKSYQGYGEPYYFLVRCISPDSSKLFYQCGLHYRDDHLTEFTDYSTDYYGNLHRSVQTTESFLDRLAENDLKNVDDRRFIRHTAWKNNEESLAVYEKRCQKQIADDPYKVLDYVYSNGGIREYALVRNGKPRRRYYSARVEAARYADWAPVPQAVAAQLNNPFMAAVAKQMIAKMPNAKYDKSLNQWIYTVMYYTDWRVSQRLVFECPEEQSKELYANVYLPCMNNGVYYTDELRKRAAAEQKERNMKYQKMREEKQKAAEEKRANEKARRDMAKGQYRDRTEQWKYLNQTQKEINEIRKAAYENTRRTQAKTREIWSDTLRGDTRFVDKYGDEHVIHTYDRHAYKSGDTYVTSDSRLDIGGDWEELEKKKY